MIGLKFLTVPWSVSATHIPLYFLFARQSLTIQRKCHLNDDAKKAVLMRNSSWIARSFLIYAERDIKRKSAWSELRDKSFDFSCRCLQFRQIDEARARHLSSASKSTPAREPDLIARLNEMLTTISHKGEHVCERHLRPFSWNLNLL